MTEQVLPFDARDDQASRILRYLQDGGKLTPMDALQMFGCFRLGGRIYDLKKAGYKIESEMVKLPNGKRVARYSYQG